MSQSDEARSSTSVEVTVALRIDLPLLRLQKRALLTIRTGSTVTAQEEDAVEGILNLLDAVQDAIADQGIATESEVFGFPAPERRRRR